MELALPERLGMHYKSLSQKARKITEAWVLQNLFCPACGNALSDPGANTNVYDFYCKFCVGLQTFQLKSQKKVFRNKILGAEYNKVRNSFLMKTHPSLILLEYTENYFVKNLTIYHRKFIEFSCIQARKPLSPNAKRAGWQGCNILIDQLPEQGKISIITNGLIAEKFEVLERWREIEEVQ